MLPLAWLGSPKDKGSDPGPHGDGAGSSSEKGEQRLGWDRAGEQGVTSKLSPLSPLYAGKSWGGEGELAQELAWETKGCV